ncbi:hypothetical protein EDB92DRAFT_1192106 [Lactarius akahatsu]|uniref:Fungal STAND N-terminal Goodbye domain-containing protein n=1 Tax=Lactarius akahatsu TaxID=416441 RepID=A0AAD4LTM0_9AGAM|nr:hypothetical protein EDB92DRAFT_1192106 [Lactarius akahatsu]
MQESLKLQRDLYLELSLCAFPLTRQCSVVSVQISAPSSRVLATLSIPCPEHNVQLRPPASNFISIFEVAAKKYKKLTKQDLNTHPFSVVFDSCDSPDAVLNIFRKQAEIFDETRNDDERLIKWLDPMVHILFTFSAAFGEGVGLTFAPAKVIFAGVGVLLTAAKDAIASYDTLASLFEQMQGFLQRLGVYSGVPLTPAMTEVLGKIMAEVLSIFALVTKEMKQSRFKTGGMDGCRKRPKEIRHAHAGRDADGGGKKLGGHAQR